MKGRVWLVGLIVVLTLWLVSLAQAKEFPLRAKFPKATPISTQELLAKFDQAIIIDVRSKVEYDIFHIKGAHHIPIGSLTEADLLRLRAKDDTSHPLVFYCNGPV